MKKKILISTGGSGGHVIPAEIINEHLKNDFEIYFSTDIRGLKYFKFDKNHTFIINSPNLNINFFFPFKAIKIIFLIFRSINFLIKNKITKVISTGGYMSLPVLFGAKILGLKIYLLEPNFVLGRANKFFLNFSEKIFCYTNSLLNFPKKFLNKMNVINPLVFKKYYEKKTKTHKKKNFCLLVVGGSQGAHFFDNLFKEVNLEIFKKHSIKVIQQTGANNIENLKKFYDKNNVENEIFYFKKDLIEFIDEADLCITRAGASTLAELSIMNKPFIAIPLPTAKDNHQFENANFYQKLDCCWVIDQKILDKTKLIKLLNGILENKNEYINKSLNLKKLNDQNLWNNVNQKILETINEN